MPIDRDQAVHVALRLVNEDGLDKLTVRRLATQLRVQAPALYWHFASKRALLDHLAHALLAPVADRAGRPHPGQPWWRWLETTAVDAHTALLACRDGGRIALGADLTTALALGTLVERSVEVLHSAGFGLADASRAAGALTHFILGRAVEDQQRPPAPDEHTLVNAPEFPYPLLGRAMREREAEGTTRDDDFRYAVRIMTTGLRTMLPTPK